MFKTLASTLASIPPPLRYLIVKVVLAGALPYAPEYKKLEGSYASKLLFVPPTGTGEPTFVGLGKKDESLDVAVPAPN